MPKLTKKLPSYRLHKRSGQAIVNLSGKDIYLGPHGTKTSKAEYDRVIGEWLANGRILPESKSSKPTKISDLMFAYWKFAKGFYVKRGKPTGEIPPLKSAIRTFRKVYGKTNVSDFGPLMLIAYQNSLVENQASAESTLISRLDASNASLSGELVENWCLLGCFRPSIPWQDFAKVKLRQRTTRQYKRFLMAS